MKVVYSKDKKRSQFLFTLKIYKTTRGSKKFGSIHFGHWIFCLVLVSEDFGHISDIFIDDVTVKNCIRPKSTLN